MRHELDTVLGVIQEHEGAHSNTILHLAAKALEASTVKAGNRLKRLVEQNEAHMIGLKVYAGPRPRRYGA